MGSEGRTPDIAHDDSPELNAAVDDSLLVAAASLVIERASGEAVAVLRRAGIRAILIKGPVQQGWLAAAGEPRASMDVDLLVDPAQAAAAGTVFSTLGYRAVPEVTPGVGHHAMVWTAPGRVLVEVHDTLWGADGDAWGSLASETECMALEGEEVEVPNEAARCLVVALHAAHHGVGDGATRYDLERALVVAERSFWARAAELARAVGAEAAFAAGLGLVPAGEELRADLGLQEPVLTGGLALDMATPKAGAAGYHWFSQQRGLRARGWFVLRKLIPPAEFMRFKHPFARRGRGHLALVYLYRPVWLARWAIPGLREWRRIRSTSHGTHRTSK